MKGLKICLKEKGELPRLECFIRNSYFLNELMKHLGVKKPPDYGQEVTQMFSQRNNPYCELLLKICIANI